MKKKKKTVTDLPTAMPTCLNEVNRLGGFCANHAPHCTLSHYDGTLEFRPPAEFHLSLLVTADRPNGSCCMNVCGHHAEYERDRDGKEYKRSDGAFIVTGPPIIDAAAPTSFEPRTRETKPTKPAASAGTGENVSEAAVSADQPAKSNGSAVVSGALLDRINACSKDNPLTRSELTPKERKLARDLAAAGVVTRDEAGGRIAYFAKG